jgi:hypothetical protein
MCCVLHAGTPLSLALGFLQVQVHGLLDPQMTSLAWHVWVLCKRQVLQPAILADCTTCFVLTMCSGCVWQHLRKHVVACDCALVPAQSDWCLMLGDEQHTSSLSRDPSTIHEVACLLTVCHQS